MAAAGLGRGQALEEVSIDDFDEMLAVNLRAPFRLAQRTVPACASAASGGCCSSRRRRLHRRDRRAALRGVKVWAAWAHPSRLASSGVTVNALAPALITETSMLPRKPEDLRNRVPVGRLGRPEEVADLAILRNPYMTNQVVLLDGGIYPH